MVTFSEVKDQSNLLTLDQVREKIEATEPLNTTYLSSDSSISFEFEPDWALSLESSKGIDLVNAAITVNGREHQLTKDAALQAGAAFGLPGKHAAALPINLLEQELNYWYGGGMGDRDFHMLTTGPDHQVAAFTKTTVSPYSNRLLLDNILSGIKQKLGESTEIWADYKIDHSLVKTDIRLILPDVEHEIVGGGIPDVPSNEKDMWYGGLHLTNSLIGKSQTRLEPYLFRWCCTNGATAILEEGGIWSRRRNTEEELDVYEWARASIDDVLGGLEDQFDRVQALTKLSVPDTGAADVVREIFDTFSVPVSQRQPIIDRLATQAEVGMDLSMYSIMNAITQEANTIAPDRADRLMRVGGALPSSTFDVMKAKIWAEGHTASPEEPNPYDIKQIA